MGNCYLHFDFLLVPSLQLSKIYTLVTIQISKCILCLWSLSFFFHTLLKKSLLAWNTFDLQVYLISRWASLNQWGLFLSLLPSTPEHFSVHPEVSHILPWCIYLQEQAVSRLGPSWNILTKRASGSISLPSPDLIIIYEYLDLCCICSGFNMNQSHS